jgi:hypothetical protein
VAERGVDVRLLYTAPHHFHSDVLLTACGVCGVPGFGPTRDSSRTRTFRARRRATNG